jgi:hypothetical protein
MRKSLAARDWPSGKDKHLSSRSVFLATWAFLFLSVSWARANQPSRIEGGGTTILVGGTGSPNFVPVTTMLGIQWDGDKGSFDCLALAPSHRAGFAGSGTFDTNIMYVTGEIRSVSFDKNVVTMTGTADCTGLGAGIGVPFTATAERGGPGARITLKVSGLSFEETLISGRISF